MDREKGKMHHSRTKLFPIDKQLKHFILYRPNGYSPYHKNILFRDCILYGSCNIYNDRGESQYDLKEWDIHNTRVVNTNLNVKVILI